MTLMSAVVNIRVRTGLIPIDDGYRGPASGRNR
jgi:hypothetical protein